MFHDLKISDIRQETPDAVAISFEVPEALKQDFAFEPGQYLTLRSMVDGEDVRRSYSIASLPGAGLTVPTRPPPHGRRPPHRPGHLNSAL